MRTKATGSRRSKRPTLHQSCRNNPSLNVPAMAICGRPDIGAILLKAITGYRAHGRGRPRWVICGRRATGDFLVADTATTMDSGAGTSVTTAALTTYAATWVLAIKAALERRSPRLQPFRQQCEHQQRT